MACMDCESCCEWFDDPVFDCMEETVSGKRLVGETWRRFEFLVRPGAGCGREALVGV